MCDGKNCQSTKFIKPGYGDQNCQYTVFSDKNCQDNKSVIMQPVKPQIDMQSKEPAMQSSFKKKHVPFCNDKNCQSTRCYKKKNQVKQGIRCSDKNLQEIPNVYMQPERPAAELNDMQSVTKSTMKQSNPEDKNLNLQDVSRKSVQ